MITCNGENVVGLVAMWNGKDGLPRKGTVVSQRKTASGNLLTVDTANGMRSVYFEKADSLRFIAKPVRNTDDGYDALKDRHLENGTYDAWRASRR